MSQERSSKMASIRRDFSDRSRAYDDDIVRILPHYEAMLEAAIDSLPFGRNDIIRVVDLGTGTGALAWRVKERFPNACILCVDMTIEMMDVAKERFEGCEGIEYLEKDFYDLDIPEGQDAVVASLSLHHLVCDDDKKNFYAKVWRSLHQGGVFVNADAVLSSDEWVDRMYKMKWREHMSQSLGEDGIEAIFERHRREDALPELMNQIRWLQEVGFSKVDIIWKNYMGAVVWARK